MLNNVNTNQILICKAKFSFFNIVSLEDAVILIVVSRFE